MSKGGKGSRYSWKRPTGAAEQRFLRQHCAEGQASAAGCGSRQRFGAIQRGFFSIDAASAFTLSAVLLASFLLISSAARQSAEKSASGASGRLFALRLSSFILSESEEGGQGICENGYAKAWVIDSARLRGQDLDGLRSASGRSYASVSLSSEGDEPYFAESGAKGKDVYCTPRLVIAKGKMARMEVCAS